MKTYKITKHNLDQNNYYIGKTDLSNFDGNIESDENLGIIHFKFGIKSKFSISVSAGSGISAGRGISAKLEIKCNLRIFAGICNWRFPTKQEMEIRCGEFGSEGMICYGNLIETGLPEEEKIETIKVGTLVFNKQDVEKALCGLKPIR